MSLYEGRCMEPKDKRPGITTFFCVYEEEHTDDHSWAHTPEYRKDRIAVAEQRIKERKEKNQ